MRVDGQPLVVHEVADEAIALGADDAAGRGGVVGEPMRQRRADDLGAELRERVDGAVVGGQHVRVDAHPLRLRHHGEPESGDAARERRQRIGGRPRERLRVARIGSAQHAVDQGRVLHGARHGPRRVQGGGQRQDAVRADPPRRHLEPDDAAPRGGQAHRAARVGADGDRRQPAPTATPEPLDDPPGVRWTARSQGFHGVPMCVFVPQLPMANSTVCVLPRTIMPAAMSRSARVAVTGDTRSAHTLEPARGDAPLEVDQILERDGHAVERAHAVAGADRAVGAFRGEPGVGRRTRR